MEETYRYSILKLQPSLRQPNDPSALCALIVETNGSRGFKKVLIIGFDVSRSAKVSDLGSTILGRLPDALASKAKEAIETQGQGALSFLTSQRTHNLFLTEPQEVKSADGLYALGFALFAEHLFTPCDAQDIYVRVVR